MPNPWVWRVKDLQQFLASFAPGQPPSPAAAAAPGGGTPGAAAAQAPSPEVYRFSPAPAAEPAAAAAEPAAASPPASPPVAGAVAGEEEGQEEEAVVSPEPQAAPPGNSQPGSLLPAPANTILAPPGGSQPGSTLTPAPAAAAATPAAEVEQSGTSGAAAVLDAAARLGAPAEVAALADDSDESADLAGFEAFLASQQASGGRPAPGTGAAGAAAHGAAAGGAAAGDGGAAGVLGGAPLPPGVMPIAGATRIVRHMSAVAMQRQQQPAGSGGAAGDASSPSAGTLGGVPLLPGTMPTAAPTQAWGSAPPAGLQQQQQPAAGSSGSAGCRHDAPAGVLGGAPLPPGTMPTAGPALALGPTHQQPAGAAAGAAAMQRQAAAQAVAAPPAQLPRATRVEILAPAMPMQRMARPVRVQPAAEPELVDLTADSPTLSPPARGRTRPAAAAAAAGSGGDADDVVDLACSPSKRRHGSSAADAEQEAKRARPSPEAHLTGRGGGGPAAGAAAAAAGTAAAAAAAGAGGAVESAPGAAAAAAAGGGGGSSLLKGHEHLICPICQASEGGCLSSDESDGCSRVPVSCRCPAVDAVGTCCGCPPLHVHTSPPCPSPTAGDACGGAHHGPLRPSLLRGVPGRLAGHRQARVPRVQVSGWLGGTDMRGGGGGGTTAPVERPTRAGEQVHSRHSRWLRASFSAVWCSLSLWGSLRAMRALA